MAEETGRRFKEEPKKKRIRIRFGRLSCALALLIVVAVIVVSIVPVALSGSPAYDRSFIREYGNVNAAAPKITASSAIMYSIELDKAVYEKNADERMAPYSITKLLTCYLALENLDPDQVLTASKNATKELEDAMELELEPGEKHKAIDLVYASMLMSANDGAIVLGEGVSGSEKKFAKLMNKTVREWGCKDTHFVNPNGWDDKDHYTTAHDMAIIVKHCLENEKLKEIALTKRYTMPASNMSDELEMENALLKATDNLPGLIIGKTGSWSETQCSIALAFKDKELSAIIVLLGDTAKGRLSDPRKLISVCHELTPGFIVTRDDKNVAEAWVKNGVVPKVSLDVKGLRYAYPSNGKASSVKIKTEVGKLEAPIKKGDKVGKYYIYTDNRETGKGWLYAGEDVEKGWFPSMFFISNHRALITLLSAALVLLTGFVLDKLQKIKRQ